MNFCSTLDFSKWSSGSKKDREEFVTHLMDSLQTTGFVKLTNHGFDGSQLKEAFEWSAKFFHQPLEVKEEVLNTTNPARGYLSYGSENATFLGYDSGHKAKDAKESFDQGAKDDSDFPNKWPQSLPGFQNFMEAFYDKMETACLEIIKAIELGLGIQDESISKRCYPCGTDFRLTHYPPIPLEELTSGRRIRIASHVDFGVIGCLFQDATGGFEIEDRDNPGEEHFIPLPPSDTSEMLVNVGATMQRWTNDRLLGGLHRVAVPEPLKGATSGEDVMIPARMSIAYLHKASKTAVIAPLPAFVGEDNPAKYPEMTGLEYHQWCNNRFY